MGDPGWASLSGLGLTAARASSAVRISRDESKFTEVTLGYQLGIDSNSFMDSAAIQRCMQYIYGDSIRAYRKHSLQVGHMVSLVACGGATKRSLHAGHVAIGPARIVGGAPDATEFGGGRGMESNTWSGKQC